MRRRFSVQVELDAAELGAHLAAHPAIQCLASAPTSGDAPAHHRFQAWPSDHGGWTLRPVASHDSDHAPVVELRTSPEGRVTRIDGEFLHRPRVAEFERRIELALIAFPVALVVLQAAMLGAAAFLVVMPALFAITAYELYRQQPSERSMRRHGHAMWGLIGELFVPHAIGWDADSPFRRGLAPAAPCSGAPGDAA